MSWDDGYRTDITYTYGYYADFNPTNIRACLIMAGLEPPEINNACELGYGQGASINIHAAAENINWAGTDFNPSQASFAQAMAEASGARIKCYAESFQDFCNRDDLPEFDYIALHGIWSWISPQNQAAILKFLAKKLRIGGVLYISYNTFPGWAPFVPVRELLENYVNTQESPGAPIIDKIKGAFAFARQLSSLEPGYFRDNPVAQKRLELLEKTNHAYVAHEMFNKDWRPCSFTVMANTLADERLTFACPANLLQCVPNLGLNAEQQKFINNLNDPILIQTLLDFIRNTQFRKDIWIKGPKPLSSREQREKILETPFILTTKIDKLKRELKTQSGNLTLSEPSLTVAQTVFADGKSHTVGEMEACRQRLAANSNATEKMKTETWLSMLHCMSALNAAGMAQPAQPAAIPAKAKNYANRLNLFIANQAIDSGNIGFLASPETGGGVPVGRFAQLFWLAGRRGAKTSAQMANFALQCLNSAGQQLLQDGKPVQDQKQAMQNLQTQAEEFLQNILPVLKNLQIA